MYAVLSSELAIIIQGWDYGTAEKLSTLQQMVSKRAAFQCTVFQKIKQCQKEERTQKVILPLSKTMASPSFENCAEGSASPSRKG